MPGFVNIGGLLIPESSKPTGGYFCRICKTRLPLEDAERHAKECVRRNEEAVMTSGLKHRLPELYSGHDVEREQWLKTPAGREWFRRNVEHP